MNQSIPFHYASPCGSEQPGVVNNPFHENAVSCKRILSTERFWYFGHSTIATATLPIAARMA
ncbi:MAG: hypothetical protein SPD11_00495 [Sphaerochaetaceae bacterium]|nr:hypothetical protein [Sphaerochaetaceae bacterium]